jgi:cobalamin biosynthesis protein CobD/CbiB
MKNWKSKLFGDNRMNFYGWICTGLLLIGLSAWLVLRALKLDALRSPSAVLLIAIYLLLLGLLGLTLQNYCARVAKAIEDEDTKKGQK